MTEERTYTAEQVRRNILAVLEQVKAELVENYHYSQQQGHAEKAAGYYCAADIVSQKIYKLQRKAPNNAKR